MVSRDIILIKLHSSYILWAAQWPILKNINFHCRGIYPKPSRRSDFNKWGYKTEQTHTNIQIPLRGYVGLIYHSSAVAIASWSSVKGMLRIICSVYLSSCWSSWSVPSKVLQLAVTTVVLLVIPCLFMKYKKILMVWVHITLRFQPRVIRTQTINIVCTAWEQTGGNEFITQ